MSTSDDDEVESVVPSAPSEYESDSDHDSVGLDPDLDSNFGSDIGANYEPDPDPQALEATMVYPSCGLCRFEFEAGEEFVVYNPVSQLYPRIWYGEYEPAYEERVVVEKGFHPCCVKLVKPKTLVENWPFNLSEVTSGRQHYLLPPMS
ncbi:hypothetical protein ACKLNR_009040 [Fusarium oxysporum f. sp. zingiberi]